MLIQPLALGILIAWPVGPLVCAKSLQVIEAVPMVALTTAKALE